MGLRRLVVVCALAAIIAAIPLSNAVLAGNEKVDVCHFPDDKDVGHVISVSSAALDVHVKMHGDATKFSVKKGSKDCVRDCKPKGKEEEQACGKGEIFDPVLCRCVPVKCEPQKCHPGFVWSSKLCECVPEGGDEKPV